VPHGLYPDRVGAFTAGRGRKDVTLHCFARGGQVRCAGYQIDVNATKNDD
jgi:hypothetical protein